MTIIQNKGIYSTNYLNNLGYTSNHLTKLIRSKKITRIKHGYYTLDPNIEQFSQIIALYPEAIICLRSALYWYGYIKEKPEIDTIAVSKAHNRYKYQKANLNLKAYFRDDKYINLGIKKMYHENLPFYIYDKERTICDCLRRKDLLDPEEYKQAIKAYLDDPSKNIERLSNYASILRIKKKIDFLLEVWL